MSDSNATLPLATTIVHKFGMEFHALLNMDGPNSKKKSKMTGVTFHPVRPWVAAVESKEFGIVWNYETKEVIKHFSLQIGDEATPLADKKEDVAAITKSMTTTFSPKLGSSKAKATSVLMFFDRETISHVSGIARGIDCFEEWLIIFTLNKIVFCDINDPLSNRVVTPDELGKASPTSIEMLPGGFLAIGCSDGKIRVWSPRLWTVCHVIDMGVVKEIPHMILVPDAAPPASSAANAFHCYLITVNQDGKAIVWSIHRAKNEFQQSRACEFDTKDANKRVDLTTVGFHEMKLLLEDNLLVAISRDGNVLMWDISFLRATQAAKEPRVNFLGAFHSPATAIKPLHGTVFLGSSKQSYVYLTCFRTSTLNVSELHKGKANQELDISAHRVDLVKDVQNLHSKISKKIKLNTITQSPRNVNLIAAATNYGLLLFHMHSFTRHTATLFPSLSVIVLNTPTHLRTLALAEKGKKELHQLKYPNKDSISTANKHPTHDFLAIMGGANYEIVGIDPTISYRMIAAGAGAIVAWHSQLLRFAVLVADEDDAARRARAAIPTDSPRRKMGFFGKTEEVVATGPVLSHYFKHEVNLKPHLLAIYDIAPDTGMCTRVIDKLTSEQHMMVHAFSGPLLGIVRFALPEDAPKGKTPATPTSVTASSVEATLTGTSITAAETTVGMRTYLEFYEWETVAPGATTVSGALKKVGPTFGGPLIVAWERANKYGVLVYAKKCVVVKWDGATVSPLHEMLCTRPVASVLWVHQTLFTATEDEIQCYFLCGSRVFSFCIASTTCFHENVMDVRLAEFPVAQRHPGGLLNLLGVYNEQLFLSGLHQSVYSIDLKNEVLQFCMFVAQGSPKRALELVPHISDELLDWLAAFLEAFGFPGDALQVQGMSLHLKASICVKHMLVHTLADLFPSLVAASPNDSPDILGTSLVQRACAALCRGGHDAVCLAAFPICMQAKKYNDGLFVAMAVQDKGLVAQALSLKRDMGHALYGATKKNPELDAQWNQQMDVYSTTHGIRPAQFTGVWKAS
ncbi:Aste57867_8200 [Aphanomyces stellatus]|uniref:Aste57867_8200 protein n=1 Tax=Aphanomyces stellatus TaxID=120398 RepID=A0A485KJN3_9STRA|nr:hypothetical protein As57867_008169 [Aphanomyces stellatus]VFT85087.1 Aste57867_8200 [Aphanomyces stellatus]